MMVGKIVKDYFAGEKIPSVDKETVLEVRNYDIADSVYDINFKLYKGEILGFAGVLGSGIHHPSKIHLWRNAKNKRGHLF